MAAGPVNTASDIAADPHVQARGLVHRFERPEGGPPVDVVGSPLDFLGEERSAPIPSRWPGLGAQTERVLSEWLGLPAERIAALKRKGVVG